MSELLEKFKKNIHSTEMTQIHSSIKSDENEVYNSIRDKRKQRKPKSKVGDLVRTSILREIFCKGDVTSWRHDFYTKTKILDDTVPIYYLKSFPEM